MPFAAHALLFEVRAVAAFLIVQAGCLALFAAALVYGPESERCHLLRATARCLRDL